MLITFDGDGGGIGAHLRHYVGDSLLAKELGIQHYSLHPVLNTYFVSNILEDDVLENLLRAIVETPSQVIWLDQLKEEETISSLKLLCGIKSIKFLLSGKHHYSRIHLQLITNKSRVELKAYYLENKIGKLAFEQSGERLRSKMQLSCNFYSLQIRSFADSIQGRRDFISGYSYLLDQFLSRLSLIGREQQFFLATDDTNYKNDVLQLLRAEGYKISTRNKRIEHTSYLFYYLSKHGKSGIHSQTDICEYLMEAARNEKGKVNYCSNAIAEMSLISKSSMIISTYSSYPIVASMLGKECKLEILSANKTSLPLMESF